MYMHTYTHRIGTTQTHPTPVMLSFPQPTFQKMTENK